MTNTINVRELKPAKIDNRTFYSRLWQLTLPIALQSFMLASVAAADALMLGRIAQNEMAAVSLALRAGETQTREGVHAALFSCARPLSLRPSSSLP